MKRLLTLFFSVLTTLLTFAQDTIISPVPLLRHEMTPEEMKLRHLIGRGFVETDPPVAPVRNVAEFDRMQGALVRYPFGIPISLIKEMATEVMVTTIVASTSQKTTVLNQYIANGVDTSHCNFLIAPTDSYWTRDYGPWFECDSSSNIGIVDFPYNRPRPNDDEIPKKIAAMLGINWYGMNVIHTGGNYMCDGFGIGSSTDLVYAENPSQTNAQVDEKMHRYLGITDHQVVPDPNISTTIDHIDCWSKFLAPNKILIRKTLPSDPEYTALENAATYWASQTCSFGGPFKVYRVMTPNDQPYTNSVILNNKVLVPFMNTNWDDSAKAVYETAMPGYEIIGFTGQPSTPWLSTDALHCRVIGIADIGMLRISHIPVSATQPSELPVALAAMIIASSHQPLIADSLKVWYRVNGGTFHWSPLQWVNGNDYLGQIPPQAAGSHVEYYLAAADQSGRYETMPLVGAGGPYSYTTVHTNLTPIPDTLWFRTHEDCLYGKISHLTNLTSGSLTLDYLQMGGLHVPWYVDSISVPSIPAIVSVGNDVAVRVKVPLIVMASFDTIFRLDTLQFHTQAGMNHLIIMVDERLITGFSSVKDIALGKPFPNPFKDQVSIPVKLNTPEEPEIQILSMDGILVRTIKPGILQNKLTLVSWDGKNDAGMNLPAGVYLIRMKTSEGVGIGKMVKW